MELPTMPPRVYTPRASAQPSTTALHSTSTHDSLQVPPTAYTTTTRRPPSSALKPSPAISSIRIVEEDTNNIHTTAVHQTKPIAFQLSTVYTVRHISSARPQIISTSTTTTTTTDGPHSLWQKLKAILKKILGLLPKTPHSQYTISTAAPPCSHAKIRDGRCKQCLRAVARIGSIADPSNNLDAPIPAPRITHLHKKFTDREMMEIERNVHPQQDLPASTLIPPLHARKIARASQLNSSISLTRRRPHLPGKSELQHPAVATPANSPPPTSTSSSSSSNAELSSDPSTPEDSTPPTTGTASLPRSEGRYDLCPLAYMRSYGSRFQVHGYEDVGLDEDDDASFYPGDEEKFFTSRGEVDRVRNVSEASDSTLFFAARLEDIME